jgi:hypothetical protein
MFAYFPHNRFQLTHEEIILPDGLLQPLLLGLPSQLINLEVVLEFLRGTVAMLESQSLFQQGVVLSVVLANRNIQVGDTRLQLGYLSLLMEAPLGLLRFWGLPHDL